MIAKVIFTIMKIGIECNWPEPQLQQQFSITMPASERLFDLCGY
jgi:hypothetical protein